MNVSYTGYFPLPSPHQPTFIVKRGLYACAVWLAVLATHPGSTARVSIRVRQFTPIYHRQLLCIDVLH